jgi:cation diffusion facilitator CzcD-associated flavoprotein CzcO
MIRFVLISFDTRVTNATWLENDSQWAVKAADGREFRSRHLIWCTGYFSKRYIPQFKGLGSFKGICHHTSEWPQKGVDFAGKRVGVIGTGASGVQTIQEVSTTVKQLTVFQRTPNTALPMQQKQLGPEDQHKERYPEVFKLRMTTPSGFIYENIDKSALDDSDEERRATFERLYKFGGFAFYLGSYKDVLTNPEANKKAYDFWREKTWERINDPVLREKLAPKEMLHVFGAKRPCLEQRFYEVFNQSNVELVDTREHPIDEITEKGVKVNGKEYELDILVLATGYDAVVGGFKDLEIRGRGGKLLNDEWADGVYTYLGMSTSGFPNMWYVFGPQSPFCNGPTAVELQGNWIVKAVDHCFRNNIKTIESTPEADKEYKKRLNSVGDATVFGLTASWFWGSNIPGNRHESMLYLAGVPIYTQEIEECEKNGYAGYVLA